MLEFLVHKCIKDADEIERPEVRKRYGFSPPSSESSAM